LDELNTVLLKNTIF